MAETLIGENNPGGKLTVTYPRKVGQVPVYYDLLRTVRPRNLYKSDPLRLWPFEFKLSYTTFTLTDLKLSSDRMKRGGTSCASILVTNKGTRKGDELVQLYVRDEYASLSRPALELNELSQGDRTWSSGGKKGASERTYLGGGSGSLGRRTGVGRAAGMVRSWPRGRVGAVVGTQNAGRWGRGAVILGRVP